MAAIISFEKEVDRRVLRKRSLICFISLNERSAVAVDVGQTMARESKVFILANVTQFASLLHCEDLRCSLPK